MSIYRLKLQAVSSSGAGDRLPSVSDLVTALEQYKELGQGVVIYHNSLYDYKYDTKLSDYTKVDSKQIVGHLLGEEIEDNQLFLIIEFNDTFDPERNCICFYRAIMESNPSSEDRRLKITNLFAIDYVAVLDSELTEYVTLSSMIPYREQWQRKLDRAAALAQIGIVE